MSRADKRREMAVDMLKCVVAVVLAAVFLSCGFLAWCCCAVAGRADEAEERMRRDMARGSGREPVDGKGGG